MIIYSDSHIIEREWLPKLNLGNYVLCNKFEEYIASEELDKIAFTAHRVHITHDLDCTAYNGFEDKINKLAKASKLVFALDGELHDHHWEIWNNCHHSNVYWAVPGAINDNDEMSSHIVHWSDWFKNSVNLYKQLPNKLNELTPYTIKPKFFDALLGTIKPHRSYVFDCVNKNNLVDKFIMPYGWGDFEVSAKDYFIWEPGVEYTNEQDCGRFGTFVPVNYYGIRTLLSRVIPIQVFNDTAYSIVAETHADNTMSFFTEKTAKPILARRLFVVFSGYKFLKNLRDIGFKTFDGIIDESYDLEYDNTKRFDMAFEQVKWLCDQDQQVIYQQIQPIVEHNFDHLMNTDWTEFAADKIHNIIKLKI